MKQREYIAELNRERLSMIHHLIGQLVPIRPLKPIDVAVLKRAAITCTKSITIRKPQVNMDRLNERLIYGFENVGEKEAKQGRADVKKFVYAK